MVQHQEEFQKERDKLYSGMLNTLEIDMAKQEGEFQEELLKLQSKLKKIMVQELHKDNNRLQQEIDQEILKFMEFIGTPKRVQIRDLRHILLFRFESTCL